MKRPRVFNTRTIDECKICYRAIKVQVNKEFITHDEGHKLLFVYSAKQNYQSTYIL